MKHIVRVTAGRPRSASTGLFLLLNGAFETMFSLVVRQRQSAWKTPFPQPIFFNPDDEEEGGGGGDEDV